MVGEMVYDRSLKTIPQLSIRFRSQTGAAAWSITRTENDVARTAPDAPQASAMHASPQTMPEDERRIVELAKCGDWTENQDANRVRLSSGAVRSRACACRPKLRDALLGALEARL